MVGVMKIMTTSSQKSCSHTVVFSVPAPAAGHCHPMPPPESPEHSQASLGQFLVGSLLISPGSGVKNESSITHRNALYSASHNRKTA